MGTAVSTLRGVSVTTIIGVGVWLGWLVAAAKGVGVAGLLLWQEVRARTVSPSSTKNKRLISRWFEKLVIMQKRSQVAV
ncbi:MAG: hypothetical protein KC433_00680 [Anaerolineales bacterium]|nr:hypothetical protein [Anaerolineales bacterium]